MISGQLLLSQVSRTCISGRWCKREHYFTKFFAERALTRSGMPFYDCSEKGKKTEAGLDSFIFYLDELVCRKRATCTCIADRCNRNRTDFLGKRILLPPMCVGIPRTLVTHCRYPIGNKHRIRSIGRSRTADNVLRSIYACARSSEKA